MLLDDDYYYYYPITSSFNVNCYVYVIAVNVTCLNFQIAKAVGSCHDEMFYT